VSVPASCKGFYPFRADTPRSLDAPVVTPSYVLKRHPLAEFIVVQVYESSANQPNIRDCVRLASMCQTE